MKVKRRIFGLQLAGINMSVPPVSMSRTPIELWLKDVSLSWWNEHQINYLHVNAAIGGLFKDDTCIY